MKKNKMSNLVNRVACGATSIVAAATCFAGNVLALNSGVGDLGNKYKSGVRNVVGYVGGLLGFGIIAFGVFNIIIAFRNEDSEGRNKALINIVAGVALTATSTALALFL